MATGLEIMPPQPTRHDLGFRPSSCGSTRSSSSSGPVFSFEFFPPKTDEGRSTLKQTLDELKDDEPAYVSVTYGAGGTTRNRTVEITKWIKQDLGIEAMAHLSLRRRAGASGCVEILDQMRDAGIENVLALRGRPAPRRDRVEAAPGRPAATPSS